jgi:hypothetical protein
MKYHKWTEEEKDYLRRNYGKMSRQDIADHLGLGKTQVKGMAKTLGLQKQENLHKFFRCEKAGKRALPPGVRFKLVNYAPILPSKIILQGQYIDKKTWGKHDFWLYMAALTVAVGVRRSC